MNEENYVIEIEQGWAIDRTIHERAADLLQRARERAAAQTADVLGEGFSPEQRAMRNRPTPRNPKGC